MMIHDDDDDDDDDDDYDDDDDGDDDDNDLIGSCTLATSCCYPVTIYFHKVAENCHNNFTMID